MRIRLLGFAALVAIVSIAASPAAFSHFHGGRNLQYNTLEVGVTFTIAEPAEPVSASPAFTG
jgi:hypothetical protein